MFIGWKLFAKYIGIESQTLVILYVLIRVRFVLLLFFCFKGSLP